MTNGLQIRVENSDILAADADVIVLKFADAFYGADEAVARVLNFSENVPSGRYAFVGGSGIAANEALFLGVGPLQTMRYGKIRQFGKNIVEIVSSQRPGAASLALTMHGPGYGLDEIEAFYSLVAGLLSADIASGSALKEVSIVELVTGRAERLKTLLSGMMPGNHGYTRKGATRQGDAGNPVSLGEYGVYSEKKPRLFVAMPFNDQYLDEYEIAFSEAAHKNDFLCERLDLESYVGDVVSEIKTRILAASGILALLNDYNPNVFLEIGFAMAHEKPIILVVKDGFEVPFDVRGQRYLRYSRIGELRSSLMAEISNLKSKAMFQA